MNHLHRASFGHTYGSEAQQKRRAKERPFRYVIALEALSRHSPRMTELELAAAADRLLAKYLAEEPAGTLQVLGVDGPFTVEEIIAINLTGLYCEVLCREGKAKRISPGVYQVVTP